MRYLGLDLGKKSLGISISDKTGLIASFYENVHYDGNYEKLINIIQKILNTETISEIVLGLPKNMNNSLGNSANEILKFKTLLENSVDRPIHLEDERLTTKLAESVLIKADVSRKKRKKVIDGLSAVIILQSYLDRRK